jgi:hypothetical protein
MPLCCWSHLPLHRALLDQGGGDVDALYVCNARRRRPLWHLDRIRSRGGDASTTTPTTFIWTFLLCDLQGYVDLISLAHCFASHRSDLGLFLFVIVGIFLFSMLRNPSEMSYKATQYKNYNGLNDQQKNVVIMHVEKQIKVLLCFSSASNLAFKICYELNNCYLVLVLWEQWLFKLSPSSIIDG